MRALAPLLVAAVAWAAALPGGEPVAAECRSPALAGRRGALIAVDCEHGAPLGGAARLLFGVPLDLNRADAAALDALPGIGPGRAAAIVTERRARPFCTVGELARVAGLGPTTRARIAPFVATPAAPGCAGS